MSPIKSQDQQKTVATLFSIDVEKRSVCVVLQILASKTTELDSNQDSIHIVIPPGSHSNQFVASGRHFMVFINCRFLLLVSICYLYVNAYALELIQTIID